jgi:hypothetical protein
MAEATTATTTARGPVRVAQAFVLSLMIPFYIPLGPVLLMPHRAILLLVFVPFFLRLFVLRRAGPVLAADWLLLGGTLWCVPAFFVNHPAGFALEAAGIRMIEFFGAYLLARVAIRSAADFIRVIRVFFFCVLVLLPFAALESLTGRPVMLDLLPGTSVREIDTGYRLGLRRAQTIFAHPILYGVFVSTAFGLFWYALRPRWLRFPAMPVVVLATFFSLSAGALLSILVQAVFIGWETIMNVLRRRWMIFAGLSAAAYLTIDLLSNRTPFHVLVDYATFNSGAAYNRILIWRHGTDNVFANPVFGIGFNDWARPAWMGPSVDNFWLLLTMQAGLPAIAMILLALAAILRRVGGAALSDPDDRMARTGYLVAFGGLFIAGGTVHYWNAMMAFVMFVYGSGLWACTGGARGAEAPMAAAPAPGAHAPRLAYTRQPAPGQPIPAGTPARARPARRRARTGSGSGAGSAGTGRAAQEAE